MKRQRLEEGLQVDVDVNRTRFNNTLVSPTSAHVLSQLLKLQSGGQKDHHQQQLGGTFRDPDARGSLAITNALASGTQSLGSSPTAGSPNLAALVSSLSPQNSDGRKATAPDLTTLLQSAVLLSSGLGSRPAADMDFKGLFAKNSVADMNANDNVVPNNLSKLSPTTTNTTTSSAVLRAPRRGSVTQKALADPLKATSSTKLPKKFSTASSTESSASSLSSSTVTPGAVVTKQADAMITKHVAASKRNVKAKPKPPLAPSNSVPEDALLKADNIDSNIINASPMINSPVMPANTTGAKRSRKPSSVERKSSDTSGENTLESEETRRKRKNNREKERRSEFNSMFDKLTQLLGLPDEAKMNKISLLACVIDTIGSLQTEIAQLKDQQCN
mmetsp:Transcript_19678/g.31571  ORF Transcript_19678/g.31571 Transcript_19678/m.31571 type:complete len:388 (+) Transcript_19678:136-1299(+)|eukprot:CAMPEP_0171510012 /NCGR_PEP_ID=MMETSP0959-20130129/121_1 /TAXON_ID=87120 /ORGANISM="Aurantiochytrium limacinum, Strain ATCCMYA-1381" /LENGTH=387 /DNA_ID=CAMNT_0012047317 /DNA_START=74 /DNA_END=1237 /DNA_ORIENTATION=-